MRSSLKTKLCLLLSAIGLLCYATDYSAFVDTDGVARAYCAVPTWVLSETMDTNLFVGAVTPTGEVDAEGLPEYRVKTIGEAVLTHLIITTTNDTAIIPLAEMVAATYRTTRCTTNELALWDAFLGGYDCGAETTNGWRWINNAQYKSIREEIYYDSF